MIYVNVHKRKTVKIWHRHKTKYYSAVDMDKLELLAS